MSSSKSSNRRRSGTTEFKGSKSKSHLNKNSNIYSNEFESDVSSRGSVSYPHSLLQDTDNTYDNLKNIDGNKLISTLSNINKRILFDSLMKVYSGKHQQYIDIAAILTKNTIYFSSPNNYQIWLQFKDRTKIDKLVDDDTKIQEKEAILLSENLDIIDDEKVMDSKVLPYFRGKTMKMIKLNILLSKSNIPSITYLFGISMDKERKTGNNYNYNGYINNGIYDDDILDISKSTKTNKKKLTKTINSILIIHIGAIQQECIEYFMLYVFDDIPWIDEENDYDSKIITLQSYYDYSIIITLNQRIQQFCQQQNIDNSNTIQILPNKNNKIQNKNKNKNKQCIIKIVDLKKFKKIIPTNLDDNSYCFKLSDDRSKDDESLLCQLTSNNARFEWITHIDYAVKHRKYLNINDNDEKKHDDDNDDDIEDEKKNHIDIYMNDYTTITNNNDDGDDDDDDEKKEEFSTDFNFGVYLNYWEIGYDNSIIPKYSTLREELLKNKYYTITRKQYYVLYEETKGLYIKCKNKIQALKAQDIGVNNKKFNIPKGTRITINHLIALKVYCDYTYLQRKFKINCRKYRKDESLKDLVKRNREIANWCRYIKECCSFYGHSMNKKMVVYTGLKRKLIFNSLKQNFESPLSTTTDINIGSKFADTNGILLQMQRANRKSRFFDVSWLSKYPEEREKLIMGSSLKIIDIFIRNESSKHYISAILMFEKIIDGQFIDSKDSVERKLYSLIQYAMDLEDKRNDEIAPKYFMALFKNMTQRMKKNYGLGSIWINQNELHTIKHEKLKDLFVSGTFFDFYGINMNNIHQIREYIIIIDGEQYQEFQNTKPRQYVDSASFQYKVNDRGTVEFHLEICAKYSDEAENCGLFLHLDKLPENVERIRIAFDLQCKLVDQSRNKQRKYRHLMTPQWLSIKNNYCGFQVFPSRDLERYTSVRWVIGVKIFEDTMDEKQKFDMDSIVDALHTDNKEAVLQYFKALFVKNQLLQSQNNKLKLKNDKLQSQNQQNINDIKKLREMIKILTQSHSDAPSTPKSNNSDSFNNGYKPVINSPSSQAGRKTPVSPALMEDSSDGEYESPYSNFFPTISAKMAQSGKIKVRNIENDKKKRHKNQKNNKLKQSTTTSTKSV